MSNDKTRYVPKAPLPLGPPPLIFSDIFSIKEVDVFGNDTLTIVGVSVGKNGGKINGGKNCADSRYPCVAFRANPEGQ
jgi:hypothetical protein